LLDNERERFHQSANSTEVSWLRSRHAAGKPEPPKKPMTFTRRRLSSRMSWRSASLRSKLRPMTAAPIPCAR